MREFFKKENLLAQLRTYGIPLATSLPIHVTTDYWL